MKKFVDPLIPDTFYHIYNRACGFDKIFVEEKNYRYFMDLFEEKMAEYVDLYCYCLIPNHFHLLIKTKALQIGECLKIDYSKKFGNLFAAYAQSFNHYYGRKGNLFSQNFRRKAIVSDEYLKTVVIYIHRNPIKHRLVQDISDWKFSSYREYLGKRRLYCKRNDVLEWFASSELFKFCHTLDSESDIE